MLNLIVSGIIDFSPHSIERLRESGDQAWTSINIGSWSHDYGSFISNIAFCILAYSGIESVIQTAGYVENWKLIRKSYLFLALTVGIMTPFVAALALSAPIEFAEHEGDLITHYATLLNGAWFGVIVAVLASFTLMMAVNTAFVASSELIERVAHRYDFQWIIETNRKNSLYRVHILNGTLFSAIILITSGSQAILADMYAIGIVASFCINMGALLIYRYSMGTKEIIQYSTSRTGTLILFVVLTSCFGFLAWEKPHGTALWGVLTCVVLVTGTSGLKTKASGKSRAGAGGERDGCDPLPRRDTRFALGHLLQPPARGRRAGRTTPGRLHQLLFPPPGDTRPRGCEPFPAALRQRPGFITAWSRS